MPSNKKKKRNKSKAKATKAAAVAPAAAAKPPTSNMDMDALATVMTEMIPPTTARETVLIIGRSFLSGNEHFPCLHGLPSTNLDCMPECKHFLTTFFNEIDRDAETHIVIAVSKALSESVRRTSELVAKMSLSQIFTQILSCFECMGVACILDVDVLDDAYDNLPVHAMAVATLQLEDMAAEGSKTTVMTEKGRSKLRDLLCGGNRSMIKFFRKRIQCSCLDSKYMELKTLPRTGRCAGCDKRVILKDLLICSACKLSYYCSRECQLKDWPSHKVQCSKFCSMNS